VAVNPNGPSAQHGLTASLPFIVAVGVLSAVFFSATWVVNRHISLADGPWEWNAILRYPMMLVLIVPWLALRRRDRNLAQAWRLFRARPLYWMAAGSLGCGIFYTGICFAGDRAPGWVLATTWQVTILLSPVVLRLFGLRVPIRGLVLMALIFVGAIMVNLAQIDSGFDGRALTLAALALLIAAFAYPFGNQLLNLARRSAGEAGNEISHRALSDPYVGLFLMSFGSLPFWLAFLVATRPELPPPAQFAQIGVVAVSSGVIATALFFWARNATHDPYVIAAVDATQAFEVVMAILGEALLLGGAWPGPIEWLGIFLVVAGVAGLSLRPRGRKKPVTERQAS
jgi:drug/metabolite transporter (DMT)-like permease